MCLSSLSGCGLLDEVVGSPFDFDGCSRDIPHEYRARAKWSPERLIVSRVGNIAIDYTRIGRAREVWGRGEVSVSFCSCATELGNREECLETHEGRKVVRGDVMSLLVP